MYPRSTNAINWTGLPMRAPMTLADWFHKPSIQSAKNRLQEKHRNRTVFREKVRISAFFENLRSAPAFRRKSLTANIVAVVIFLLAMTGLASAQDTTIQQEAGDQPPAEQTNDAFWSVQCNSSARFDPLVCNASQAVLLTENGQRLILFFLRTEPDVVPRLVAEIPPNVFIPAGFHIFLKDQKIAQLGIQTCNENGCIATKDVGEELIETLSGAEELAVAFSIVDQNTVTVPITVPIRMTGFAEAYARIRIDSRKPRQTP